MSEARPCPRCGAGIAGPVRYCSKCGAPVPSDPVDEWAQGPEPTAPFEPYGRAAGHDGNRHRATDPPRAWLWIGGAVAAAVIALLVVVLLLMASSGDDDTAGGDPTPTTTSITTHPHSQVVVQVLNGSGIQGAATARSYDLKAQQYQVLPAGNAPATRTGSAVQCRTTTDATELVAVLGAFAVPAVIEPLPNPAPPGYDPAADCYLVLGR